MIDRKSKYSRYVLVFVLIFVLWFVAKLIGCGSPLNPIQSIAPVIVSVLPADKSTGAALNAAVSATFDKDMDPATISTVSFTLTSPAGAISGSVTYDAAARTAAFAPAGGLAYSTTYVATVSAAVKEVGGVAMEHPYTWGFSVVNPSGNLDPTFSDGTNSGYVVNKGVAGQDSSDTLYSLTVDGEDKIVATGTAGTGLSPGTAYMFILKYNSNGSFDTAFHSDGKLAVTATAGTGFDDRGWAVTTDSLNNILVAGTSLDPNSSPGAGSMVIWRYKKNGSPDTSFAAGSGKVIQSLSEYFILYPYTIALDAAGKILVAGSATTKSRGDGDLFVARYNSDGTLDQSFGNSAHKGFTILDGVAGTGGNDNGRSITLDPAGNILVAGFAQAPYGTGPPPNTMYMVVYKFTAGGSLDTSFGDGTHAGYSVYNGALKTNSADFGQSIALGPSGKIYVAGNSLDDLMSTTVRSMVLWKLSADGRKESTTAYTAATSEGNAVTIDGSGKILVAGMVRSGLTSDIGIWRYDANGAIDPSFGVGGVIDFDLVSGSGPTRGSNADIGNAIALDNNGRIVVGGQTGGAFEGFSSIILRYK